MRITGEKAAGRRISLLLFTAADGSPVLAFAGCWPGARPGWAPCLPSTGPSFTSQITLGVDKERPLCEDRPPHAQPLLLAWLFMVQGQHARADGRSEHENPYRRGSEEYRLWAEGWHCADDMSWVSR